LVAGKLKHLFKSMDQLSHCLYLRERYLPRKSYRPS